MPNYRIPDTSSENTHRLCGEVDHLLERELRADVAVHDEEGVGVAGEDPVPEVVDAAGRAQRGVLLQVANGPVIRFLMTRVMTLQSASIAQSQGLLESFHGSSPGRWAILQLLCSQTRRKLPEELTQKCSSKPCD